MLELTTKNVGFEVQGRMILEDINIAFPAGARTAILGANGSGKSTLLRIIAGFNKKHAGKVLLAGTPLEKIPSRRLAQMMAVLPQKQAVPADLTVEQLVSCGRFPYRTFWGAQKKDDAKIIKDALYELGLEHFSRQRLDTLSGGEMQKVWLAMAICQQPQILLLDEPTTYLDIANQIEIMEILADLNKRHGMTIIMVLHDVNHARIYADYAVVLDDRHLLAQGPAQKVIDKELLAKAYGVKADVYENKKAQPQTVLFPNGLQLGDRMKEKLF